MANCSGIAAVEGFRELPPLAAKVTTSSTSKSCNRDRGDLRLKA
jgi:hypothetical protein